jgi:hypothetical protein
VFKLKKRWHISLQKQCIFKQSNRYAKEKERNRKLKLEREDLQITNHKKISAGGLRQPV